MIPLAAADQPNRQANEKTANSKVMHSAHEPSPCQPSQTLASHKAYPRPLVACLVAVAYHPGNRAVRFR